MSSHRITHIRKPDRNSSHEHITHVAYDGYVHPREEVIHLINSKMHSFYVQEGGEHSWVGVVRPEYPRLPYLRTYADNKWTDNLLSLPQC